jgi:CRISPR-associated protein Csb1
VLEAHRLNSPYITNADGFAAIKDAIGFNDKRPFDPDLLVKALLKFDPNSLLHGIFLEKIAGVIRLPRALTAFIEATEVTTVASGGVKNDRVRASKGDEGQTAKEGFGNVPFHREEFTGSITAYFNLDLALIRGFGLGADVETLLAAIALLKIQRFLRDGLRLRTACDLDLDGELSVQRPAGFVVPTLKELEAAVPGLIAKVFGDAKSRFTVVTFEEKAKPIALELTVEPAIPEDLKKFLRWKKATKTKSGTLEIKPGHEKSAEELADLLYSDNDREEDRKAFFSVYAKASTAESGESETQSDNKTGGQE